ncbi:uncharacterized protein LOC130613345 isoform X2 [Hydractinia symbiolongicarpus]|uniref:uncharacterized protein LOC130613345 isoform X2 n=1 Tax=Hydractinia symbiolongicarpus TaxID=13093 RepID=UPI00254F282B|nr:uncharacterized protein LOC130613345 isoform X2 [Hydractinia symbiolongicarpus]
MAEVADEQEQLSYSEASAAEVILKMSEYQFIAVVQDGNTCEPMEQVINENGDPVAVNTNEYYETVGEPVELGFVNEEISEQVASEDHEQEIIEEAIEITPEEVNFVMGEITKNSTENTLLIQRTPKEHDKKTNNVGDLDSGEELKQKHLLFSLGTKLPNSDKLVREKRKRVKSSLFIGYTSEAAEVLRDFENLKEELNIKSNVEMLQRLINNTRKESVTSSTSVGDTIVDTNDENAKVLLQLFTNSEEQDKNGECSSMLQEQVSINLINAEQVLAQNDVTNVLGLTALNIKTIQLSKKYLEHVNKDGYYISGFVDGSEKLDEFLKLFRLITGSSFSIRRSKVKINDDPEPEEKPLRKYKPGYLGKGQIKWEKNIGIPPIPFTGVPFTTEGSTTYQCIYGPKRSKMNLPTGQKENTDDEIHQIETYGPKRRKSSRESKKKDCPAQIHIRTVHRFPTYNCLSPIQPVKTSDTTMYVNRCQRGIILAKLREDIINEKVHGDQGFWIRVPLPEVHQNHSLGPFDGCDPPLNEETILEMKSILQNAAISS